MPAVSRPKIRRLQCSNPNSTDNFIHRYKSTIVNLNLLQKAKFLEEQISYPISEQHQKDYEELDKIRCKAVAEAERKCRKLRMGNVPFSPTIKLRMNHIKAWTLLLKRATGHRVSSRYLGRVLKKAQFENKEKTMGSDYLADQLRTAYSDYYTAKGNASTTRQEFLHNQAEFWATKQRQDKEKIHRMLLHREKQRATVVGIEYIRGKISTGSSSMVQVKDGTGRWQDVTEKHAMEQAIMDSTQQKFRASFGTSFMTTPLNADFGYLGNGQAADEVLEGTYVPPDHVDHYTKLFLQHLKQPESIKAQGDHSATMPLETYRRYWIKAKERTSCYPGELSFSTLKAGAQDETICEFECIMTCIPLFSGYKPQRWKKCVAVMILKKQASSKWTHLEL